MLSINIKQLFLFVFISLVAISCDDDNPPAEEHIDAEGFIFENKDGDEIYRYFQGQFTGSIELSVDEELELTVHFLDDNEEEIAHTEEGGEEEFLAFSGPGDNTDDGIFDSNIVLIEAVVDHEEDDEHHEMELRIVGKNLGSTSFKLQLMHGDHADYDSRHLLPDGSFNEYPIEVIVE